MSRAGHESHLVLEAERVVPRSCKTQTINQLLYLGKIGKAAREECRDSPSSLPCSSAKRGHGVSMPFRKHPASPVPLAVLFSQQQRPPQPIRGVPVPPLAVPREPLEAEWQETHKVDVASADKDDFLPSKQRSRSAHSQAVPRGEEEKVLATRERTKGAPGSGFLWWVRGPRRVVAIDGRLHESIRSAGQLAYDRKVARRWDRAMRRAVARARGWTNRTLERLRPC